MGYYDNFYVGEGQSQLFHPKLLLTKYFAAYTN